MSDMEKAMAAAKKPVEDPFMRLDEVMRDTGLSRAAIYRKIKKGIFPVPVEIGPNSVAWHQSEVKAWKAARPRRGASASAASAPAA